MPLILYTLSIFTGLCLSFASLSADAESDSTCATLSSILSRGRLLVGTYNDDPYFSYMNPKTFQLEGFDIDLSHALAKELLGDENKVEFVIVHPQNRLILLQEGKVDIVLAELSITKERQTQVDFSDVYYIAGQSLLVLANSAFNSLADLRNQTVGILSGTTNTTITTKFLPDATIARFDSLSAGFQALRQGQIQAFSIDDVMLLGLRENAPNYLQDYRFIGGELALESYGIAMKKGCKELQHTINRALGRIKKDGRWQKIYNHNIGQVSKVSARPPN